MEIHGTVWLRGLGFIAAGALFWLGYFDLKDRLQPEPRRLLIVAFFIGVLSALAALGVFRLFELGGLQAYPDPRAMSILVYCLAVIGPVEEGTKFLAARLTVFRWRNFDEPIDGLVYACAVAIGFAAFENVLYMQFLGWPGQLVRSVTSPLTHSLFASVWGFGFSRAVFRARTPTARFGWQAGTLALSMVLHGLYDFFLLAYGATWLSAVVVLAMWIFLIVHARRLLPAKKPREFTR